MDDYTPLDYTYMIYWSIVKYICMSLITVFFVLPHSGQQTVHPNFLYLFIVCAFTSCLSLSYIITSMCFEPYYYKFAYLHLAMRSLSDLILIFLIPFRNYVLDSYIISPRLALQRNTVLSLPHLCVFLVVFSINFSNAQQQLNYATSNIRTLFSYGQVPISCAMFIVYVFNFAHNLYLRRFIRREFARTLSTTDPLELNYLVERHTQQADVASISPTQWSVMRNLTFQRVSAAMLMLCVSNGLNIMKEYFPLTFHLVFPVEIVAYIILFKPARGSKVPESLVDLLVSETDRKALMIYLQQKQHGLKQFVFLKETARLRVSTQIKQDIQYIYQKYFNTLTNAQTFSQPTLLKIRQKIMSLSQLDSQAFAQLFSAAESEALDFLNAQTIPQFYSSNLGAKLLTSNSFFENYAICNNLLEIAKLAQIRANPLLAFVELIDKHDYSTDRFLTHSDKIIQTGRFVLKFMENAQNAAFGDVQAELRNGLGVLESEFMKLTEFVRRQQLVTESYAEYLSAQIGPRPSARLQLDQKIIYYAEMHKSDGMLSSRDQTSSQSGKKPHEQSEVSGHTKRHRREIEKQFLIELPTQVAQTNYQRFSSFTPSQQQEYLQDIIGQPEFTALDVFDPFTLLRNEKIECPLEVVFKTAAELTGILQVYDFAPRSVQLFCKLVTQNSSRQTYYNVMRSMMTLQALSAYIYTLQGSFDPRHPDVPKIFSKEQVLAALLAAACGHVQHSGLDDHSIISVQHALAIIYNDRDPNQRAAATNGWSIIMKASLFSYLDKAEISAIRAKFIAIMLSFDAKNYSRLINKIKSQKCPAYSQMAELERQIRVLKPEADGDSAKKQLDVEYKNLAAYTDVLMQVVLYLCVYSDSCRKRETFELLTQDLTQQLKQQQKIETYTLQKAYLPEISEETDYFALAWQLYIMDHIILGGMQFLFQCLREYSKQQEQQISQQFREFLVLTRNQVLFQRSQLLELINSDGVRVHEPM